MRVRDEDSAVRCSFMRPLLPMIPLARFYVAAVDRALTPVQSIEPCEGERYRYDRDMAEGWKAEGQPAHLLLDDMLKAHYRCKANIRSKRGECMYIVASVVKEVRPAASQDADNFLLRRFNARPVARFRRCDRIPMPVRPARQGRLSFG